MYNAVLFSRIKFRASPLKLLKVISRKCQYQTYMYLSNLFVLDGQIMFLWNWATEF